METVRAVIEAYKRGETELDPIDSMDRSQKFALPGGKAYTQAELGLSVVDDPTRHTALEQRRDYLLGRLRVLAPQDFARFGATRQALLAVRVDTDDEDPEPYTALFDDVRQIAPPNEGE